MEPVTISFFIGLALLAYFIYNIISSFFILAINIPLGWVVLTRLYFEINKKKILYPHLIGLGITTVLFVFWFDKIQVKYILWPILYLTIMLLFGEIFRIAWQQHLRYRVRKIKASSKKIIDPNHKKPSEQIKPELKKIRKKFN